MEKIYTVKKINGQDVTISYTVAEENDSITLTASGIEPRPSFGDKNLEVLFSVKEGEVNTDVTASGGVLTYSNKTVTIKNLNTRPKLSLNFTGQIAIGAKPDGKPADNPVYLSVRFGNMSNADQDWIIDFSDKSDGAPGSTIELGALIEWIKGKLKSDRPEMVIPTEAQESLSPDKLNKFIIEFKEFHFNINKKTFNISVKSKGNQQITFGDFIIYDVGFQITNEDVKKIIAEKRQREIELAIAMQKNGIGNDAKPLDPKVLAPSN
jgi:hypothetical protein